MTPTDRSDDAVRHILGHLLAALRANVGGVLDDGDPEALHDLRVAARRTRSALGELEAILPETAVAPIAADLEWLGGLTGPSRDLDVWLHDLGRYRRAQPRDKATAVAPIEPWVRAERNRAYRKLERALASPRFRQLQESWEAIVSTEPDPSEAPPDAGTPVKVLADRRIARAYDRLLRRHRKVGVDPTAKALHRLRIAAKKLRYLLEFFRDLYPAGQIDPQITRLKALQDVLGELNDLQIQSANLATAAREIEGSIDAVNHLGAHLNHRREELMAVLPDHLGSVVGAGARREYIELLGAAHSP